MSAQPQIRLVDGSTHPSPPTYGPEEHRDSPVDGAASREKGPLASSVLSYLASVGMNRKEANNVLDCMVAPIGHILNVANRRPPHSWGMYQDQPRRFLHHSAVIADSSTGKRLTSSKIRSFVEVSGEAPTSDYMFVDLEEMSPSKSNWRTLEKASVAAIRGYRDKLGPHAGLFKRYEYLDIDEAGTFLTDPDALMELTGMMGDGHVSSNHLDGGDIEYDSDCTLILQIQPRLITRLRGHTEGFVRKTHFVWLPTLTPSSQLDRVQRSFRSYQPDQQALGRVRAFLRLLGGLEPSSVDYSAILAYMSDLKDQDRLGPDDEQRIVTLCVVGHLLYSNSPCASGQELKIGVTQEIKAWVERSLKAKHLAFAGEEAILEIGMEVLRERFGTTVSHSLSELRDVLRVRLNLGRNKASELLAKMLMEGQIERSGFHHPGPEGGRPWEVYRVSTSEVTPGPASRLEDQQWSL